MASRRKDGADVRRLTDELPHGLGERREELRIRQAGRGPAVAGSKETAKEIVARGRKARPSPTSRAAAPRMTSRRPARAPQPRSERSLRQSLPHGAGWRRFGQQRRDAQVRRRTLLQRFEQRHAGAPALAVAAKRRGRPCGEPARRSAIHPQPAAAGRPLEHNLVGGEDAAVARHEPERREVLGGGEPDAARKIVGLRR